MCFEIRCICRAPVEHRACDTTSILLVQDGPANKKRLIRASLRFLLGRHFQPTMSIGYYIGFSVEFTTEPIFLNPIFLAFSKKLSLFVLTITGGIVNRTKYC